MMFAAASSADKSVTANTVVPALKLCVNPTVAFGVPKASLEVRLTDALVETW